MTGQPEADRALVEELRSAGRPLVTICGWCPGARDRTLMLELAGNAVSHTICPACGKKALEEEGEKAQ